MISYLCAFSVPVIETHTALHRGAASGPTSQAVFMNNHSPRKNYQTSSYIFSRSPSLPLSVPPSLSLSHPLSLSVCLSLCLSVSQQSLHPAVLCVCVSVIDVHLLQEMKMAK